MYNNRKTSRDFNDFLSLLGNRVLLQGWSAFAGGLDTRLNTTGTHSVHTHWRDYDIMFHVAPLLPYTEGDRQQVEKKRHIGNDIIVIIFQDAAPDGAYAPLHPDLFKSEFIHVILVVRAFRNEGRKVRTRQSPIRACHSLRYSATVGAAIMMTY